jgi:hypothetical protein
MGSLGRRLFGVPWQVFFQNAGSEDWISETTRLSAPGKIVMWIQSNTKENCARNGTIAREGRI